MATILSGSSTMFSKLATARIVTFGPRSSLRVEDYVGGANALLSKAAEIGHGGAISTTCCTRIHWPPLWNRPANQDGGDRPRWRGQRDVLHLAPWNASFFRAITGEPRWVRLRTMWLF